MANSALHNAALPRNARISAAGKRETPSRASINLHLRAIGIGGMARRQHRRQLAKRRQRRNIAGGTSCASSSSRRNIMVARQAPLASAALRDSMARIWP